KFKPGNADDRRGVIVTESRVFDRDRRTMAGHPGHSVLLLHGELSFYARSSEHLERFAAGIVDLIFHTTTGYLNLVGETWDQSCCLNFETTCGSDSSPTAHPWLTEQLGL